MGSVNPREGREVREENHLGHGEHKENHEEDQTKIIQIASRRNPANIYYPGARIAPASISTLIFGEFLLDPRKDDDTLLSGDVSAESAHRLRKD